MHRERFRARRRLEAAEDQLAAAAEEDGEAAAGDLDAALKEYVQLFVEDDGGG